MRKLVDKVEQLWGYVFLLFFCVLIFLMVSPMAATALLFGVCALAAYKLNIPNYPLFLSLIAISIRMIIVLVIQTPPVSDFGLLFDASQRLLAGDLSYLDTNYFQLWSYQNGFVAFQSLLLAIWNNLYMLKLVNCVVASATVVLVYLIAREFAGEKASRLVSLIYCFFPFSLFYVTILSNQFLASFLIYLGLYILISDRVKMRGHFKYLAFGFLLALANVLRPEGVIPLFSAALFLLLTIKKENWRARLQNLCVLVITYFTLNWLFSQLFIITGLSPNGLTNNAPHWKFVLGFNHDTTGSYADADAPYLYDPEAAWILIRERILAPLPDLVKLFSNKIKTFWSGSGLDWSLLPAVQSGITLFGRRFYPFGVYTFLELISQRVMIVCYLLVAAGVFKYLSQKNWNKKILLLINHVFVTYGVYLLIEVQPRYAYHVQISVVILAALGVEAICENLYS